MEWTGARYADGPTAQVSTWIDATPDEVWPAVVDLPAMAASSPELQSVDWLDAEVTVGSRFVGHNRHEAMGEWSVTSHVVACEPPRVFAWAVHDPQEPAATWRFTLEPADGGTRLTEWVRLGPGRSGLSLAIERMPDKEQKIVFVRMREFEQNMTATVAAIKARVEAGS
jgi:polyketide cyclase/dehydrase/lipid transport protein